VEFIYFFSSFDGDDDKRKRGARDETLLV